MQRKTRCAWSSFSGDTCGRRGSLLIEAMLAIVLFGVFTAGTYLTLLTGQESSQEGADRIRGIHFSEQAIEIAKSIRNRDFDALVPGQHGFTLNEDGEWILSGSTVERYGYATYLLVESIASDKVRVTARTRWKHGYHRSGATVLSLEMADWRTGAVGVGDWSQIAAAGDVVLSGLPLLGDIVVDEDYAFVTSSGDDGLYIFDVSDPDAPFRVSTSFALGGAARSPVIYGTTLYVLADDVGAEVQAFDISDPTALDSGTTASASYDLPGGSNRGLSMARKGSTLFVGADGGSGEGDFFALNVSGSSGITLLDAFEISDDPGVNDVSVSGNYAVLATDRDIQEMVIMDVSSPSSLAAYSSYNATDVHNGTAARMYGTGFYLGRAAGTTIDEYMLITGSGGVPSTNPANIYGADLGSGGEGTVNAMALDTLGCYAFLATDFTSKELQIRSARYKNIPEESYVDLASDARSLYYDMFSDRLYVSTNTGFLIFTAPTGGDCL